jgi:uncharacterized repeat protein (TIGR01451 family)
VPLATGVFTNTATISSATVDSNPTNNTSAVGVTVLNMPPVALDNHYTTAEDTPLNVVTPGVLANDNDPNGDTLMAVLDAGPSHGTLVLAADGSLSYTSSLDFTGTDTFTYHASDGILASNVATVTINVGAVNDPPTALADSYTTSEDTHLTVDTPGVLANDSDPNGDTLMAALDAGPSHGTLVLAADGSFSYTPSLDFTGTDTFTYHASDGSLNSNVTTVTISVTEQAGADLAVSKDVSALTPAEGDTITYTIQITNIGSNAATGVVVTDLLPTGVTHVSDDSNGSYNPADGSWNVGDLNVGESVILHITATVDVGTAGTTITNIATISAVHQTDPNPNNNTDVAAITVKTGWMTVYLPLILK